MTAPRTLPSGNRPLYEREAVLEAVEALLSRVSGGEGGALFLSGEAGVGKSAVLAEARRRAQRLRVGMGRGDITEALLPYGILEQALHQLSPGSPLERWSPQDRGGDIRPSLYYGTVGWLTELAQAGPPLLLLLDDLHWADPDSLALLAVICRRLTGVGIGVIGSTRPFPEAAMSMARSLAGEGAATLQRLAPLSPSASEAMLEAEGTSPSRDVVQQAWDLTGGNPLLIQQAAELLQRRHSLPQPDGGGTGSGAHGLLISRFAGVDDEALRLARAASLCGVRFRTSVAAAVAGLDPAGCDAALEALSRAGVLRDQGPGLTEFVHPLFCSALADDIPASLRGRWHAQAFRRLRELGAPVAECAEHARQADLAGDPDAVQTLEEAGREALAAGAGAVAGQLLGAAADCAGSRATASLLAQLGEALLLAGEPLRAIEVATRAASLAGSTAVGARRLLGRATFYAGQLAESDRHFEAAMEQSITLDNPATAAEVALEGATVSLFVRGSTAALEIGDRADALLRGLAAPEAVGAASTVAHALAARLAAVPVDMRAAADAAALLRRNGSTDRAASLAFYGVLQSMADAVEGARDTFTTAMGWAERSGDPVILSMILSSLAALELGCGHLDLALGMAERAVELGDFAPAGRPLALAVSGELLLQLGREAEAAQRAALGRTQAEARGEWLPLMWARATQMRLAQGHSAEAALEQARWLMQARDRYGIRETCLVPWAADAMSALAAAGHPELVTQLTESLQQLQLEDCGRTALAVARGLAITAEHEGRAQVAQARLQEALESAAATHLPLERLRLQWELGGLLRRGGRIAEAREVLGAAAQAAEELGACRLRGEITEELHLAGGRRRRRGDVQLTAAERRVAELAARGMTNAGIADQLFLSTKTVDTHLQHIYAKLGINSRRELMLRGLEEAPDPPR